MRDSLKILSDAGLSLIGKKILILMIYPYKSIVCFKIVFQQSNLLKISPINLRQYT